MLGGVDPAGRAHPVQQPAGAALQPGGRVVEVHPPRRGEEARQHHGLRRAEPGGAGAEAVAGAGLDPEDPIVELHHVHVERQDPLLRERPLEPHREQRLPDLPPQALLGAEPQVLGELLRDGRRAAGEAVVLEIVPGRVLDRVPVDPLVPVEVPVLGEDHRLQQPARDPLQGDGDLARAEGAALLPGLGAALLDQGGRARDLPRQGGRVGEGDPQRAGRHRGQGEERGAEEGGLPQPAPEGGSTC